MPHLHFSVRSPFAPCISEENGEDMDVQVCRAEYGEVEALRGLYRQEANCQIIHDSALARGIADPYVILVEGRIRGYGGVWNKYHLGRVMEFYTLPAMRAHALPMFRELLSVSQATHVEAQTNMPLMLTMLYDCAVNITEENILFADAFVTDLPCPDGVFRRTVPEDTGEMFSHQSEPPGDWVMEADGAIVASGGFLCHYNPPYGDVYMEVAEPARRQGYGSYLVQEVKRVCYEAGKRPAARCNPENVASRRTLQKAGLLPCGRLLAGEVKPSA
jgi:GNAT superfamily N-acetyltransferase